MRHRNKEIICKTIWLICVFVAPAVSMPLKNLILAETEACQSNGFCGLNALCVSSKCVCSPGFSGSPPLTECRSEEFNTECHINEDCGEDGVCANRTCQLTRSWRQKCLFKEVPADDGNSSSRLYGFSVLLIVLQLLVF